MDKDLEREFEEALREPSFVSAMERSAEERARECGVINLIETIYDRMGPNSQKYLDPECLYFFVRGIYSEHGFTDGQLDAATKFAFLVMANQDYIDAATDYSGQPSSSILSRIFRQVGESQGSTFEDLKHIKSLASKRLFDFPMRTKAECFAYAKQNKKSWWDFFKSKSR